MQNELSLRKIDAYAKDAIADLDDSILNAIGGMTINNLDENFASQVEQYLRVKILFPYKGINLDTDVKRVFNRVIEILRD